MSDAKSFGSYIKKKRGLRGYSINQLATYADVSAAHISRLERGLREIPSPDFIQKLAKGLRIPYEELMEEAGYLTRKTGVRDDIPSPEEQDFLTWVERELEGAFFYDFAGSPEEMKQEMMDDLRVIWKLRKGKSENNIK